MGSGTSRSSLTRDECKQRVGEDKWDENWDEFYFAEGKSVSSELAERVWCKAERWAAYNLAQVVAEPKDNSVDERDDSKAEDAPVDRVADAREASDDAVRGRTRADVAADSTGARVRGTKALWQKGVAKIGWITHARARAAALERARLAGITAPLYEKLHGVDRSGVAEALDLSAIIAEKRGQHLQGTREWVFDAVEKWRVDPDAAKLFWLVGGGGTGKSVAAAELLARLLDKENVAAWHFCKHTEPARSAPAALLCSLAGMLCATVDGFEEALREGGGDNATDKVDKLFQALIAEPLQSVEAPRGADDALILIIDALDELPRDALKPVLSLLANELKLLSSIRSRAARR
jgi:hypothetical protein